MKLEGKQIGALIAIILGLILAFLPVQSRQITINPDELSQSILDSGDRLDPETVSQWIIEGNNEYLLMDVRSPEEYQHQGNKPPERHRGARLLQKGKKNKKYGGHHQYVHRIREPEIFK